jgi:hypothetical protein
MNLLEKAVPVIASTALMLQAGLVDSLNSTVCAKYLFQNSGVMKSTITNEITSKNYSIAPMCLNLKKYFSNADRLNGAKKFENMLSAQIEISRIKQYDPNSVNQLEKDMEKLMIDANSDLVNKGFIDSGDKSTVFIEAKELQKNQYEVVKVAKDSQKVFIPTVEKFTKRDFLVQYPILAKSIGVKETTKIAVKKEATLVDKEQEVNKSEISSVSSSIDMVNKTKFFEVTVNSLNCRSDTKVVRGNEIDWFELGEKIEAVLDKDDELITTKKWIKVKGKYGKCWTTLRNLSPIVNEGGSFAKNKTKI